MIVCLIQCKILQCCYKSGQKAFNGAFPRWSYFYLKGRHNDFYVLLGVTVLLRLHGYLVFQAETSEDLFEWKAALDNALAQAPSAAVAMGQNGIFQNDTTESIEASDDPCMVFFPLRCMMLYFSVHQMFSISLLCFRLQAIRLSDI